VLFVGVLLGLAAVDMAVGVSAVLVGLAVLARWGTTALGALAGLQAVLGPAGLTGRALGIASSWCGAGALAVAAALVPRRVTAAAVGLLAALVVAGPAASGAGTSLLRFGAAAAGAGTGAVLAGRSSGRFTEPLAVGLAAVALVLAVLA
jgi:hypothetical protein